ncbi:hypothetical protein I5515_02595 [Acinetobacter calcoaceticus]|nr:hypothetical protein [Acinetobacter calcoaceticus]
MGITTQFRISAIMLNSKATRNGTYDVNMNRIGD